MKTASVKEVILFFSPQKNGDVEFFLTGDKAHVIKHVKMDCCYQYVLGDIGSLVFLQADEAGCFDK